MRRWTAGAVAGRIEEAVAVFRRLPGPYVPRYHSLWPEILHDFADLVHQRPERRAPPPTPEQISRADEVMVWLGWLEPQEGRALWRNASGCGPRGAAAVLGLPPEEAKVRVRMLLFRLAAELNRRGVPFRPVWREAA